MDRSQGDKWTIQVYLLHIKNLSYVNVNYKSRNHGGKAAFSLLPTARLNVSCGTISSCDLGWKLGQHHNFLTPFIK